MIVGIIKKNEIIKGDCIIDTVKIFNNFTKTVVCRGVSASSKDKIIFLCENCNNEITSNKRVFCEQNNFSCLCPRCKTKITSLEKYGVDSPNKSGGVKEKQHRNNKKYSKPFENGNNYRYRKTNSFEELCELRSKNAKKKWKNGDYDDCDYSKSQKLKWNNPEHRKKMLIANNNPECIKKKSKSSKRLWREKRETMLHAVTKGLSCRLSKIHKQIKEYLKLEDRGFISEQIIGNYIVDELNELTKTIIEINGDYVHANPKKYKEFDIIKLANNKYTAKEKWEYDDKRIKFLESLGYKVIVIWESDFKKMINNESPIDDYSYLLNIP